MSSTNRSGSRLEHASDYYNTPQWAIRDFLDAFRADHDALGLPWCEPMSVLDPCAGGDETHGMAYPEAIAAAGIAVSRLDTVDIRQDSRAAIKMNFMDWRPPQKYDLVITNPPFAFAEQIIGKALDVVDPDHGIVVMLLRLNFYGGQKRKDFFQRTPPVAAYVHSKRISFTDDLKTDSIEYQHCVFAPWMENRFTSLRVI